MYIFQMWINKHVEWHNIPPLNTNDITNINKTISRCVARHDLGFLWRVLYEGAVIATNTSRAYDDNGEFPR